MTDRRMMRYDLVIGGRPKRIPIEGKILHVGHRRFGAGENAQHLLEFWAEGSIFGSAPPTRTFGAFATGEELPEGAVWCGTTGRIPAAGDSVWHLYELFEETE